MSYLPSGLPSGIHKNEKLSEGEIGRELLDFLKNSPTPFHATLNLGKILKQNGFVEIREGDKQELQEGKGYFITKHDSTLAAFYTGKKQNHHLGVRLVGAHTDSPCLKVRPNPDLASFSYAQVGVEVYGGVLLSTWFDRDLSLAGKITYQTTQGELKKTLIDFKEPVAVIPNLAIHLNRDANENRSINKQRELPPLFFQLNSISFLDVPESCFSNQIKRKLLELDHSHSMSIDNILAHDLCFYDTQEPKFVGLNKEFIASARLDNLLSCYVAIRSLLEADPDLCSMVVCNDHEEVGSASYIGAEGPFLKTILQRIFSKSGLDLDYILDHSLMISADNAHGIHPNYFDKHDPQHGPILNKGPVLKVNANQRYATNAETAGLFVHLCQKADIPYQIFTARADMGCGSTIGPITSTVLGVKTVDIGVPTFAMHSIRELAGAQDPHFLWSVFSTFFQCPELIFS